MDVFIRNHCHNVGGTRMGKNSGNRSSPLVTSSTAPSNVLAGCQSPSLPSVTTGSLRCNCSSRPLGDCRGQRN